MSGGPCGAAPHCPPAQPASKQTHAGPAMPRHQTAACTSEPRGRGTPSPWPGTNPPARLLHCRCRHRPHPGDPPLPCRARVPLCLPERQQQRAEVRLTLLCLLPCAVQCAVRSGGWGVAPAPVGQRRRQRGQRPERRGALVEDTSPASLTPTGLAMTRSFSRSWARWWRGALGCIPSFSLVAMCCSVTLLTFSVCVFAAGQCGGAGH